MKFMIVFVAVMAVASASVLPDTAAVIQGPKSILAGPSATLHADTGAVIRTADGIGGAIPASVGYSAPIHHIGATHQSGYVATHGAGIIADHGVVAHHALAAPLALGYGAGHLGASAYALGAGHLGGAALLGADHLTHGAYLDAGHLGASAYAYGAGHLGGAALLGAGHFEGAALLGAGHAIHGGALLSAGIHGAHGLGYAY